MAVKFEKKIILGSVTSFVVAAVGVIAVFFPSLLNLEKKKINEISITLNSKESANEFQKILKDNVGKIIKLDLKYKEVKISSSDKNGEYKRHILLTEIPSSEINEEGFSGKVDTFFGDGDIFNASSSAEIMPFANEMTRNKGGIGVWDKDKLEYQAIITEDSQKGSLYKWTGVGENNAMNMELSGTFLVSSNDKIQETAMPYEFYDEMCYKYGADTCDVKVQTYTLMPLSQKDLTLRDY